MKKFDDLKAGDVVVRHIPNDKRIEPKECLISKIGRKYIFITNGYAETKYDKENGNGEYGWEIFPGTLEEYNTWTEENLLFREFLNKLNKYNHSFRKNHLTKNQIERIQEILNEE